MIKDDGSLTEAEVRSRYITPAIRDAGWTNQAIREEYYYTDGKIIVTKDNAGKIIDQRKIRDKAKKADYLLQTDDGSRIGLAVVEAKDNQHQLSDGTQQALVYARDLDVPFVFTSNGDGFHYYDRTGLLFEDDQVEGDISLEQFPSPDKLLDLYYQWRGLADADAQRIARTHYNETPNIKPRYYQVRAVNATMEAIANGKKRILLVMATGTGKTYTASQIVYRFRNSIKPGERQKRILYLADRTELIDQTIRGDFKIFGNAMTKLTNAEYNKSNDAIAAYEIFLGLYQGVSQPNMDKAALYSEDDQAAVQAAEQNNVELYKKFPADFFDMVIVDECHRGSAKEESNWRKILDYFNGAVQIGLTATPIETKQASNSYYFGDPVYTYSLKDGIEDGFLAPYNVVRVLTNIDYTDLTIDNDEVDSHGNLIKAGQYTSNQFGKKIRIPERTEAVAEYITKFLKSTDPMAKTIVFCPTISEAESMRQALVNLNPGQVRQDERYVMRITGDDLIGKSELSNFTDVESTYPVIVTTSELLTTGVDCKTCKVIVLDSPIESMTKFKQVIGRGTRLRPDYGKTHFTILDFRGATKNFFKPEFDGEPIRIFEAKDPKDFDNIGENLDGDQTDKVNEQPVVEIKQVPPEHPEKENIKQPVPTYHTNVEIINDMVQIIDSNGKLRTEKLTDYTRQGILGKYANLDAFLHDWTSAKRKYHLLDEMEKAGIPIHTFAAKYAAGNDDDIFDAIVNLAWNTPKQGRRQRAERVRSSAMMNQFAEPARQVLNALLDKYETDGLQEIEKGDILQVNPFSQMGSIIELMNAFGGREGYNDAVDELTDALYQVAD
ncbi:MAG: DEAD/DEAH box helicase family protein [Candidatus Saccharibacteria bacterium]|nr:DEAD/DEAH box helicase family protein [Candidatus Saccharibacteria bacterium]